MLKALTAGARTAVVDAVHGDFAALGRLVLIPVGVGAAGVGYLWVRLRPADKGIKTSAMVSGVNSALPTHH